MRSKCMMVCVGLLLALGPTEVLGQSQIELSRGEDGPYQRLPAAVEAIKRLKSPYCPGQMLSTCPSPTGAALRDSISDLAEEGWTTEELVEWVLGRHGEIYRALPKTEGVGLMAWLGPPAAGMVGVFTIIFLLARTYRRREGLLAEPFEEVSDEDEQRLDEALKALELEEEAPFL
jgi:cytochrome c-type biogenesis protein CcmH/NrfF